jgi:hypothetical protein
MKTSRLFFLLALISLAACSPLGIGPLATPTRPVTPAPPTATLTATSSLTPTLPPTATATFTPAPTATPDYIPLTLPKGPTLIYTGSDSAMRIFWQWTEGTIFRVEWWTDGAAILGSADVAEYDPDNHLYAYDISGLQPGTRYAYRVALNLSAAEGSFRTAPGPDAVNLKFVSYGDTRTYPERHDAVAGQVTQLYQADLDYQTFNLFVGDFVTAGDAEDDWKTEFFDPALTQIRSLIANMVFLSAMGNHEGGGALFLRYFPLPYTRARYGSFDYGPAHITILDQYVAFGPGSNQYAWLEQDLAASTKKWKLIVLHEPAWSAGGGHDNNAEAQALQPLFERSGVAIVLGGHNHYYARAEVNGVLHLTVGTGGAPTYTPIKSMPYILATYAGTGYTQFEIQGSQLHGWFVAADGTVKDEFWVER